MTSTTTTDASIEIVKPVVLGPVNLVLIVISGALGLAFLVGVILITLKEYRRGAEAKLTQFKQKLNIRRKGISGSSAVRRGTSSESISMSEATSYIQLTETPTSIRCSSAWTSSPDTRTSFTDTPTSGNFSL